MSLISREDVIQILKIFDESQMAELHLEVGDFKLTLKKEGGTAPLDRADPKGEGPTRSSRTEGSPGPQPVRSLDARLPDLPEMNLQGVGPAVLVEDENLLSIRAPMLGTFYRAPNPDAPPFVEIGQVVTEESVVCIIEVMKLFNTVRAGVRGRIAKICAENAQLVEYHQILFLVEKEKDS